MQQDPSTEQRMAELLDRVASTLPLRQAPRTLEARVRAELLRRAGSAWWQRSFSTWPSAAARAGFVMVCLGLVVLTLLGGHWTAPAVESLRDAGSAMAPAVHRAMGLVVAVQDLSRLVLRVVSPDWIARGAVIAAVLYAGLFGLGTLTYRTLYLNSNGGG